MIKILSDFMKNHVQNFFVSEMLKLSKLLLVMPATNARAIIFCNETLGKTMKPFSETPQLGIG